MNKEILIELIEKGLSTYKIAKHLNSSNSTIIYYIKKYNLKELYSKFKKTINTVSILEKYSRTELTAVINKSNNFTNCLENLNLVARGGNFNTLKKYIKLYDIDIKHFSILNRNVQMSSSKPLEEYLVLGSKIGSSDLKNKLYKAKLKERVCELCGQTEDWNGRKMSLILDHINGEHTDNRLKNLQIVCPNCNATLDTHCGKHKKTLTKEKILNKENERLLNQGRTTKEKEYDLLRRKVERPSKETLENQLKKLGYCGTARLYNVSDNSIRKWIKTI